MSVDISLGYRDNKRARLSREKRSNKEDAGSSTGRYFHFQSDRAEPNANANFSSFCSTVRPGISVRTMMRMDFSRNKLTSLVALERVSSVFGSVLVC